MTPEEFKNEVTKYHDLVMQGFVTVKEGDYEFEVEYDEDDFNAQLVDLMSKILCDLGYQDGIAVFRTL